MKLALDSPLGGLLFFVLLWLAGIALAKGGWSVTAAIFFIPYAWYLVVERALVAIGWI